VESLLPQPDELHVYPSRLAADRAIELRPGDCVGTQNFTTFGALLRSLGSLGGHRYAPPLVCQILCRSLMGSGSGWVRDAARDPFAVRAVHRAIVELRQAGITARHLPGERISANLKTVADLLSRYENALQRVSLADDADWERTGVLATSKGAVAPTFSHLRRVVVQGGATLFGSRLDLLAAMASRGVRVDVRLPWDGDRKEAFAWPEASLHNLEARDTLDIGVTFDTRQGTGPLEELRAAQFTDKTAPQAPVSFLRIASRAEHGRAIAQRVRGWLLSGVPADSICVAVAEFDQLGPEITDALSGIGVPAYSRRGVRLHRTAAGRLVEDALRIVDRGFPREPLLELWRTLGRSVDVPHGALNSAQVADRVRRAGVRSARLWSFREGLVNRAYRTRSFDRDGEMREAVAIADALDGVMDRLGSLPQCAPLAEQVDALEEMMRGLDMSLPAISAHSGDPDGAQWGRRGLLRAQARHHGALTALADVFVELRQTARTAPWAGDWERPELCDFIGSVLSERRLFPAGMRAGSVAVLSIDELVETHFDNVILAGIDADVLPRASAPDLVLTEELRVEVNRLLGPRLLQSAPMTGRGALHGSARDTWIWLEALASCQKQLVVTFSTADNDPQGGRSELVDELVRSLGTPEIELTEPSYACEFPGKRLLRQRWSLGSLSNAARIATTHNPGKAVALDALLRGRDSVTSSIELRVNQERIIRGPKRQSQPLSGAQRRRVEEEVVGKVQSPSRLDLLGMCRFRFLAGQILKLEREPVPALGADAREEGSAGHAALWAVYRDIIGCGGLTMARIDPEGTRARARSVFDAQREVILEEVHVHPSLERAVLEDAWGAVEAQLEYDLRQSSELSPLILEFEFNEHCGTPPLEIESPDGRRLLRVRGSIDRVDLAQHDDGTEELLILDYKRTLRKRSPGRHFQLPVYALVARRNLCPGANSIRAGWVALHSGHREMAEGMSEEPDIFAAQLREQLWGRIDTLVGGDVSPDPDSPALCRACDFSGLCRYDAARNVDRDTDD